MNIESKREFIINFVYLAIVAVIGFVAFKNLFGLLFPFVLGFFIAFSLRPLIEWINVKTDINNSLIAVIVLIGFYAIIGTGLFFIILKLFTMLQTLFEDIPSMYAAEIQPLINQFTEWARNIIFKINPEIVDFIQQFDKNIFDQLGGVVREFSSGAINVLTSMVKKLPTFIIGFLFTVISSIFITIDYRNITGFLNNQLTGKNRTLFLAIKRNGIDVVVNFMKAYAILLGVTFVESAIGLTLLGMKNAIGISLVIAAVDILPVLGTGTILVPWSIIEFFNGNIGDAIGLIIIYGIITVIRQFLEPRVVGESIGLYPLVTLISMFLGVNLFGFWGLFGLPIVVTIIIKLQQEKIIKIYRDENDNLDEDKVEEVENSINLEEEIYV
ncbi:MAG TPA: sporulation integral membrane protein YtvI [Erysipelotrichaceae bacterium]|nr:sporulation integral membrane protein YtvI [Erysipelotrichaceae bacterium]